MAALLSDIQLGLGIMGRKTFTGSGFCASVNCARIIIICCLYEQNNYQFSYCANCLELGTSRISHTGYRWVSGPSRPWLNRPL